MAKGRIARRDFHIVVTDEETEETTVEHFYAGEEVPAEYLEYIDNESIFEGEGDFSPGNAPVAGPAHVAGERRAALASNNPAHLEDADDDDLEGGHAVDGETPKGRARRKGRNKPSEPSDDDSAGGFDGMTVGDLVQWHKDNDVDVPSSGRKADLVESAKASGKPAPQD